MSKQVASETGWRGSREGWLEAAYDALIEGGIDAVKIMPLANRLKLSRTSFYWFFNDRDELLTALADYWSTRTTMPLIAAARAYADTETEAMLNLLACFLKPGEFDDRLEFAVRSWALQDDAIMQRLQAADIERLETIGQLLMKWGHSEQDADVRARTIYLVQIGYISMQVREDAATRLTRIPGYVEIYTGKLPHSRELARFRANIGYDDGGSADN
ncbi:helix-turn-helix domain containing protein [Paracoccus sp. Z330]|uniref:Helix-turn-helix domain containing protein n=1 Tax=Paracoccus onchidii TaxID=3017813 RepID=A0ABT4ZA46_9RHOB|nr:helix-turn-helix domain-containing protein [Paracoccus onchidii]MDB6176219.1 helix-turn-helix domain containing protein [Paracoccus onchidii]